MSDLISRRELINALKVHFDSCFREDGELLYSDHICTSDDVVDLIKLVENQPIAYSVDKVVEELQRESYAIMLDGALVASKEVVVDAKRATEIVKQGGVLNAANKREIARLCDYAIAENMILTGKP